MAGLERDPERRGSPGGNTGPSTIASAISGLLRAAARDGAGTAKPIALQLPGLCVEALGARELLVQVQEIFVRRQYAFEAARPDPVIVDCGSNIGMATLYWKRVYPAARILGFEPNARCRQLALRNLEANRLTGCEIHPFAVGREEQERAFFINPERPASLRGSFLRERALGEASAVAVTRLSRWLPERVDLLKLDVEGAEHEVLEELISSGSLARVERMVIEYHHHLAPGDDRLAGFLNRLEASGFTYALDAARQRGDPGQFQDIMIHAAARSPATPR
jgi:FkbM family methyltransferase